MTEKIIVGIINASMTGGISIAVFCFLSWAFRKKYRAVSRKKVWILIAVCLMIPLNLDILPHIYTLQLPNLVVGERGTDSHKDDNKPQSRQNDAAGDKSIQNQEGKAGVLTRFSTDKLLFAIWSSGILFLIFYHLMGYRKSYSRVKRWSHDCQDEWIMKTVTDIAAEVSLSRMPKIRILESSIDGPFTMGILKNIVFLPERAFNEKDLYYILKHELIHCKKKDILWKPSAAL